MHIVENVEVKKVQRYRQYQGEKKKHCYCYHPEKCLRLQYLV